MKCQICKRELEKKCYINGKIICERCFYLQKMRNNGNRAGAFWKKWSAYQE